MGSNSSPTGAEREAQQVDRGFILVELAALELPPDGLPAAIAPVGGLRLYWLHHPSAAAGGMQQPCRALPSLLGVANTTPQPLVGDEISPLAKSAPGASPSEAAVSLAGAQ
jgi:hypothetical protein